MTEAPGGRPGNRWNESPEDSFDPADFSAAFLFSTLRNGNVKALEMTPF
jgi:hypothetical protein